MGKEIQPSDSGNPAGPPLVMNDNARTYLAAIEDILTILEGKAYLTPRDAVFRETWNRVMDLYSRYEREILSASGLASVCSPGCDICCFHWVEDVLSFEADIIASFIRVNFPEKIHEIVTACLDDTEAFESLASLVNSLLDDYEPEPADIPDPYELMLACFYRLRRPCPLLGENGLCRIYPVRPMTCRTYMNLRDPLVCDPDVIDEDDPATFIMGLSDRADDILENLHRRYDILDDCRSLRIQLATLLSEENQ